MKQFVIGVPKETKKCEGRVGMTPGDVKRIIEEGAGRVGVCIQAGAGMLSGFSDDDYCNAGVQIMVTTESLYRASDMIVKVKELTPEEYELIPFLRDKMLFTYLHLAGVDPELTRLLLLHHVTALAYECVEFRRWGRRAFPLLAPMSKIAGTQSMRRAFEQLPLGTGRGNVGTVIYGGGICGVDAINEALRQGCCRITVFELFEKRIGELKNMYRAFLPYRVTILPMSQLREPAGLAVLSTAMINEMCVLSPGAEAPKVLDIELLSKLPMGAYVADVAIDQGGSTAWSMVTDPGETYTYAGITFSCVPNIPGSTVPHEATPALTQATYPYIALLARQGFAALKRNIPLRRGLQTRGGKLMNEAVAKKLGLTEHFVSVDTLF